MVDFLLTVLNMLSFFAIVMAIAAWYNAALAVYPKAPWIVTRLPLAIGLAAVVWGVIQGWFTEPGIWGELLTFAGAWAAASFVLTFLAGWLLRGGLETREVEAGHGRLTPVMITWSLCLLYALVVTGVNSSVYDKTWPFWVFG